MKDKDVTSLLTAKDVAKRLHFNVSTIRRWTRNGMIAHRVNPRGHMKFTEDDITSFLTGDRSKNHKRTSS